MIAFLSIISFTYSPALASIDSNDTIYCGDEDGNDEA